MADPENNLTETKYSSKKSNIQIQANSNTQHSNSINKSSSFQILSFSYLTKIKVQLVDIQNLYSRTIKNIFYFFQGSLFYFTSLQQATDVIVIPIDWQGKVRIITTVDTSEPTTEELTNDQDFDCLVVILIFPNTLAEMKYFEFLKY